MSDFVEKLKNLTCGELSCDDCNEQREEAAREIESLRAKLVKTEEGLYLEDNPYTCCGCRYDIVSPNDTWVRVQVCGAHESMEIQNKALQVELDELKNRNCKSCAYSEAAQHPDDCNYCGVLNACIDCIGFDFSTFYCQQFQKRPGEGHEQE